MPRPRLCRRIRFNPHITYFKPKGVRMINLEESILTFGEFEAVRLKDFLEFGQEECAKKMNISQPTFHRLISSARKKIADAIVNGKAIKIQGGNFKMVQSRGMGMRRMAGTGGRGRMGGFATGPGGICKCPKCGYEEPQIRGQPCTSKKCPKCKTPMTRN